MTEEKRAFTNEEWIGLSKYFLGNIHRYRENIIIPKSLGPVKIKSNEEKMVEAAFESCAFKSVMSCVIGEFLLSSEKETFKLIYSKLRNVILFLNFSCTHIFIYITNKF